MVNGDYGNFSEDLSNIAQDTRWRGHTASSKAELTIDTKEVANLPEPIAPPSELTRLRVLIFRNIIQLNRDWVSITTPMGSMYEDVIYGACERASRYRHLK